MKNMDNQQSKPDLKGKAIASFIIGIIAIITVLLSVDFVWGIINIWTNFSLIQIWFGAHAFLLRILGIPQNLPHCFFAIDPLFGFLFPLIGLIVGIKGLKSTKKGLATIGIVLCIISFFLLLFAIYSCFYLSRSEFSFIGL